MVYLITVGATAATRIIGQQMVVLSSNYRKGPLWTRPSVVLKRN